MMEEHVKILLRDRPEIVGVRGDGSPIYEVVGGAVTALWYGNAFISLANKLVDIDSDTIKTMLTTSTYVPNQDTDDFKNDVTNEVSGTGYSAGGTTLTTPASLYTGGTNVWNFDADDAVWASSTITARNAVIYDSTPGTDATRPLISYVDFGGDNSTSSGTFTVQWAAGGIVKVTVS
jgi:hypothetical protein